jgi:hypothetical protein
MNNIDCSMKAESLKLLKTIKGKTLVGYLSADEHMENDILFNLVLLFADGSSIVARVDHVPSKMYGEDGVISRLDCIEDVLDKYHTYHRFKVNNLAIDDIEIITDVAEVSDSETADNYSISVGSGIMLKGAESNFVIALNFDYSDDDWLRVSSSNSIDELRPIEDVKDSWGDGEDGVAVVVHRTSRSI